MSSPKTISDRDALQAQLRTPLDALRDNTVDYYAALRSLYYQDRAVALGRGRAPDHSSLDAEFDAFE